MPRLAKALPELTFDDLSTVLVEEWPEDEQLELKQALPTAEGVQADRWVTHGDGLGDPAKKGIFKEVVAFANSYGGDLILGIEESDDPPKRAARRMPIPKCHDLAERLAITARNVIDPQIPRLEFRGIPINDTGEGYVVIRVPKSRAAPHRLTLTKECYRRRGGSSEAMTMREIQDLTFTVARGVDAVNGRLAGMRKDFQQWIAEGATHGWRMMSLRVNGAPSSSDLFVERVHQVAELVPPSDRFQVALGSSVQKYELNSLLSQSHNWRPVLRGTRAMDGDPGRSTLRSLLQLDCDGAVSYFLNTYDKIEEPQQQPLGRREYLLNPGWLFGLVLNALKAADRFRAYASAHAVEYAFEIEIVPDIALPVHRMTNGSGWHETAGVLPPRPLVLPRYAVGSLEDRDALLNLIWRDFWNSVGVDTKPGEFQLHRETN